MTTFDLSAALNDLIAQAEPATPSQETSLQEAFAALLAGGAFETVPSLIDTE